MDPLPSDATYSVDFFDLQLRFATKVAALSGVPLTETVGTHTNLYVRLGMGPRFDCTNPAWLDYVSSLATTRDPVAWTYEVYRRRAHLQLGPELVATFGCFSYAFLDPNRARLHFRVGPELSTSPLSMANLNLRTQELAALLSSVAELGDDVQLVGASWLYNLQCYRRLFPQRYLESLKPMSHPYQRMPLWGQFLNRDRTVRGDAAHAFNARLANAERFDDLKACFPFRVFSAAAPAKELLHFV